MKKAAILILASTILLACGNSNKTAKSKFVPKADTIKTLGAYVEIPYKTVNFGLMYVVIRNRVVVDSFLNAKEVIDTIPYIYTRYDTSGNFRQTFMEAVSFDFKIDSGFAKLSRFIKLNDKYLKTDSTGNKKIK